MIRMDLRRRKIEKASIFPLKYRETETYVQVLDFLNQKEIFLEQVAHFFSLDIFMGFDSRRKGT
jgi:hypothetical protein